MLAAATTFVAAGLIAPTTVTAATNRAEISSAVAATTRRCAATGECENPAPLATTAFASELATPLAAATSPVHMSTAIATVAGP